jgi:hypothetical protein
MNADYPLELACVRWGLAKKDEDEDEGDGDYDEKGRGGQDSVEHAGGQTGAAHQGGGGEDEDEDVQGLDYDLVEFGVGVIHGAEGDNAAFAQGQQGGGMFSFLWGS